MSEEDQQLQEMTPGLPWNEERQYAFGTERFEPLLRFFKYAHLPPQLAEVSKPFASLAHQLVRTLPKGAERTAAVRRLLESKDCAVRALLPVDDLDCVASDD